MSCKAYFKCCSFSKHSIIISLVLIALVPTSVFTAPETSQNQTTVLNQTTNVFVRSPSPQKSLFSSQLFQQPENHLGLMKSLTPYPLRESYIAFEQAHPAFGPSGGSGGAGGQSYDEYFKPSKFTTAGFDASDYYSTRLQNSYPPAPGPPPNPTSHYYPSQHHDHSNSPLYLPLPPPPPPPPFLRLVKIPDLDGDLKVTVSKGYGGTNDVEIFCEFPGYLLIVQQIYWHVIPSAGSPLLPYGTFYDSRNGFGPRVTVTSISKWKSVLRVRDYTEDDFGTYRCVSTAILPDDPQPSYSFPLASTRPPPFPPSPPTPYRFQYPPLDSYNEVRSSASTIASMNVKQSEIKDEEEKEKKLCLKRDGRIRFYRNKREVGTFGVYAPFFKPYYGIYRVYKQFVFYGDRFSSGSDVVENTINGPEKAEVVGSTKLKNVAGGSNKLKQKRNGRRSDLLLNRKSKVLF